MREDHGRPPAKPPWIKTTNTPTARPQEYQHELSKSEHHQEDNTSKTNNTSFDQKQHQNYLPEKPIQDYIREPTSPTKDNDTDVHGVCALWRLFLLAVFQPQVLQQVYNTIQYATHLRAFAIVFITTATTTKEIRPTEVPQTASSPRTDPNHQTKTKRTAATRHRLRVIQRKTRRQASTQTQTVT
eukprot:7146669-Ditylum_brightwellii.AAC.1